MFCAVSKIAFVECVLCAFGQMLELALEVVSASGLCLAGGSRGAGGSHLCRWDHTESHGPDPGLAGHQEMRQAVGDTLSTGVVPEEERLRIRV